MTVQRGSKFSICVALTTPFFWVCILSFLQNLQTAFGEEFTQSVERDFFLKTIGELQISNLRGKIEVQGWALDKIRIKAVKKAQADSETEAKDLFKSADFRYGEFNDEIELSAEYGKGLDITARLKEREKARVAMDIVVLAPSRLKLRISGVNHAVRVYSWNAPVEIRTQSGGIQAENLRGSDVLLSCSNCSMSVENIQGNLRCVGGSEPISLKQIRGKKIYVETSSGSQWLEKVVGEQLYVSKEGSLGGRFLEGSVEFHTTSGAVLFESLRGFASGRTESGAIQVQMREWKPLDRALFESVNGKILIKLPSQFSGEIDVWSLYGKARVGFPVKELKERDQPLGPQPKNQILGWVGNTRGDQLKIYSRHGDVELEREI